MESQPRRRRRARTAYSLDSSSGQWRTLTLAALALGLLVVLALVGLLVANVIGASDPDTALSLQLGGQPRRVADLPRNFRLWTVYPDNRLRFRSAYFPLGGVDAPLSEVVTVAAPLVSRAEDILSISYFGALNITGVIQHGPGADTSRLYELFSLERDPAVASYGVNVLTANPPYISADTDDKSFQQIAMGAPPQNYYRQMVWAIALPPGSQISSSAFKLKADTVANMLPPYRRVSLDGWTVYYFDTTKLDQAYTIRIRFKPPPAGPNPADPDFWNVDRMR